MVGRANHRFMKVVVEPAVFVTAPLVCYIAFLTNLNLLFMTGVCAKLNLVITPTIIGHHYVIFLEPEIYEWVTRQWQHFRLICMLELERRRQSRVRRACLEVALRQQLPFHLMKIIQQGSFEELQ
jgi:hypothetical protein